MRYSRTLIPTLKEAPAEAQVVSHILLTRAGYIRKLAAGVYSLLPLGVRVVQKIERIVREELGASGAEEVLLPMVHPAELWQESGRWQAYGPELLRFADRKGAEFAISPTAEEAIVDLVRRDVSSYRQLPLNLYQIQDKFRDEVRPRAGLMRGREFVMKDAYSFHADEADAQREYRAMYDAYCRIFRRCGLDFRPVEADTGTIGGSVSHEFQVLADSGEDAIVACDRCDYAANVEKAEVRRGAGGARPEDAEVPPCAEVHTPGKKTIEEVAAFLDVEPRQLVKAMVYREEEAARYAMALIRGDRQLNVMKLRKALGWGELRLATDEEIREHLDLTPGFLGPAGELDVDAIYADEDLAEMGPAVIGANKADYHVKDALFGRDFEAPLVDLKLAAGGEACARCGEGHYRAFRGIEVGQVFFLGTKYSVPMKCTFLDAAGQEKPMVMGCYGIGITRVMAAAIEQNHDDNGIIWPLPIAPFHVEIVAAGQEDDVRAAARELYQQLSQARVEVDGLAAPLEVLFDDRDERPGSKFKDADLIGIPLRLTIGKKALADGVVEIKERRSGQVTKVPAGNALAQVKELVERGLVHGMARPAAE